MINWTQACYTQFNRPLPVLHDANKASCWIAVFCFVGCSVQLLVVVAVLEVWGEPQNVAAAWTFLWVYVHWKLGWRRRLGHDHAEQRFVL